MFDYTETVYTNATENVIIICKEHGRFEQSPNNHLNEQGCPKCAHNCKSFTEQFIERSQDKHGIDHYDYSDCIYVNNYTKLQIT